MPRPGRPRGARPTRSPTTTVFGDKVIEMYNHPDDMPTFSNAPKKRPRHATRGAAAAERRQESSSITPNPLSRRPSTRSLRLDPVPMKPPHRSRDTLAKALKHHDCTVCLRRGTDWSLLKCIRCARCVHSYCLNPPETSQPKRGVWTCDPCSRTPYTKKKQAGRVLKEAVENFPFLVPHRYLDTMTDALAVATAAEVATAYQDEQDHQDLGHTTIVDPPKPADPAENTVVLKVESDDSDLEDLRPLADIRDEVRRDAENGHDDPVDGATGHDRPDQPRLPNCIPSVPIATNQGDHVTEAPEIVPVGPPQRDTSRNALGSGDGYTDMVRRTSARGGRGSRRGRPPRSGKDRCGGDDGKPSSSSGKVFVKLRRRPPALVPKEKAKPTVDEKAKKEEMHKRLAKARAKKAELRAMAREKSGLDRRIGDKLNAGNKRVAANEDIPAVDNGKAPIGFGMKETGSTNPSPTSGVPNIGAAVTQIAAMQGVVTPMAAAPSQSNYGVDASQVAAGPSQANAFSSTANRAVDTLRTNDNASSSQVQITSLAHRGANSVSAADKSRAGNVRAVHRHDLASPVRQGYQRKGTKLSPSDPFGTARPKPDSIEVIEIRDSSPERSPFRVAPDGVIKPSRRVRDECVEARGIRIETEKGIAQYGHAPAAAHTDVSSLRVDRATESPLRRELSEKESPRDSHPIKVEIAPANKRETASNCTPEQRTAAIIRNLFRPSGSNPKAVNTNWTELKHDAKNEALFTLAKEQKGAIGKRRASARASSDSLDRHGSARSSKSLHRTDNVPESEKKRMHMTALMVSSRARATVGASVAGNLANESRKGSISRLLIDPTTMDATQARSSPQASIGQGRAQQVFDVDQPVIAHAERQPVMSHDAGASKKSEPGTSAHSLNYEGDGSDYHVNQRGNEIPQHVNMVTTDSHMPRREQQFAGPPWDSVMDYDGQRAPSKGVTLPSSNSGSQSEPGPAAARGMTAVQTLKKRKKRTTLATTAIAHSRRPPEFDKGRATDVLDRNALERSSLTRNRQGWSASGHPAAISRRPGHSLSSLEHDDQNSAVRRGYLHTTTDMKSGRDFHYDGQPMEPPPEPQSFKKLSRNDSYVPENAHLLDPMPDVRRYHGTETGLDSVPTEDNYGHGNVSLPPRDNGGIPQRLMESHSPHNHVSPHNQVSPHRAANHGLSNQAFPSPVFPGDYQRESFDEGVPFADSRRLRRSAAPTVPTATRRFQYEQGRQLARFTNSAQPPEHQQAYSATRRQRTQSRHSEVNFAKTGSDWNMHREDRTNLSQPLNSYPSYSHVQASGNVPTLNHRVISQEGVRPQLAPVIYESDNPARSHSRNHLNLGTSGISRLKDASQLPVTQPNHPPIGGSYQQDYSRRGDQTNNLISRYRTVPQSRITVGPLDHNSVHDHSSAFSRTKALRTSNDQAIEAMEPRLGSYVRDHSGYNQASDFPSARGRTVDLPSTAAHVQDEYMDEQLAPPAQEAQPARTDPSLKNLLA